MTDETRRVLIAIYDKERQQKTRAQADRYTTRFTTPEAINAQIAYIARITAQGYLTMETGSIYLEALTDALIKAYTPEERRPTA